MGNFFEANYNFKDDYDYSSGGREGGERTFRRARRVGPRRVGGPKFRAFFPSTTTIFFHAPLFWGLLVEFWWCLKRRGLKCSRLEFSGCSVKPRRPRGPGEGGFGRGGGGAVLGEGAFAMPGGIHGTPKTKEIVVVTSHHANVEFPMKLQLHLTEEVITNVKLSTVQPVHLTWEVPSHSNNRSSCR